MSSLIEITDDDMSFEQCEELKKKVCMTDIVVSDDEDSKEEKYFTSDEDELPNVVLQEKKKALVKTLFPSTSGKLRKQIKKKLDQKEIHAPILSPKKVAEFTKMIEGVSVNLPVNPYGSQIALMSMLIKAIKRNQNCLLESPTGSGKTLALLCGALGWQFGEKAIIGKKQAEQYFSHHPELKEVHGAKEYIASPMKKPPQPESFFTKTNFGIKSIYDEVDECCNSGDLSNAKRLEPCSPGEEEKLGEVTIHKKRRLDFNDSTPSNKQCSPTKTSTPEKNNPSSSQSESPKLSAPIIYYGARTHKQIEQVIKEFKRTWYCGEAKMTVLASREHACLREYDRNIWKSKNDMCRECIKVGVGRDKPKQESNCKFYDNREALNHRTLPPAFDLEDLIKYGYEHTACPYYGARGMVTHADIVFCPYNYLIEPSIRSSMRIDLTDNIVIIDEAHNIEDICRDAATVTATREQVISALKELEKVAEYRFAAANQEVLPYVDSLIKTLKCWDDWFVNQIALVKNQPVNNNEAVHTWHAHHFVQTLNNHNIGQQHYTIEFKESVEIFCKKLREDPRSLYGVTQATCSLLESLDMALGYLFRDDCKYIEDFKPAFIRSISRKDTGPNYNWRNSQFDKSIDSESLSLRLLCMNPALVFEGLKSARCIVLASGTLTPLVSLHSELATDFSLKISPSHIIPRDRVWIGSLMTTPDGSLLECKSAAASRVDTQDAIGQAVLGICRVTPNGVLCFVPSYMLLNKLMTRWSETGVLKQLESAKHVFQESRMSKDHNDVMEEYYSSSGRGRGALLLAVYRGKVSEGMDFKDHQARAVVTVGIPYPSTFDIAVKEKMNYNDKFSRQRSLLSGHEWLKVQAYRALNQAVGRCVRHRADWGAVVMLDARFRAEPYTHHLSKWVRDFLGENHHTFDSLFNGSNSLTCFMRRMVEEDI